MQHSQREPTYPEEVEQRFALEMRHARRERGLSQTALAKQLERFGINLDGTAITRMEKNANDLLSPPPADARAIRLGEAAAIAGILGITFLPLDGSTAGIDRHLEDLRRRRADVQSRIAAAQDELGGLDVQIKAVEARTNQRTAGEADPVAQDDGGHREST